MSDSASNVLFSISLSHNTLHGLVLVCVFVHRISIFNNSLWVCLSVLLFPTQNYGVLLLFHSCIIVCITL